MRKETEKRVGRGREQNEKKGREREKGDRLRGDIEDERQREEMERQ